MHPACAALWLVVLHLLRFFLPQFASAVSGLWGARVGRSKPGAINSGKGPVPMILAAQGRKLVLCHCDSQVVQWCAFL